MTLPLTSPAEPPERPTRGPRGESILLVEDEDQIRRLVGLMLESSGYTVLSAADGAAALDLASGSKGAVALLLTDIVMPGLSGRELAGRLCATHPTLRVLFMSGNADDARTVRDQGAPGWGYLQKPFRMEALLQKVRALLDLPLPPASPPALPHAP